MSHPPSKDKGRDSYYRRTYGISLEQFNEMLDSQDNKCGICRCNLKKPCVDHCHKTGQVRGILCSWCNQGLGKFKDRYELVAAAARYLAKTQCSPIGFKPQEETR